MAFPPHPVGAVTHPDPYPYYAELVARSPLYRDAELGLWVASSVAAVTAILTSERCRVRPPREPVPKALLGSPSGEVFGALVRMNDGARHAQLKPAVSAALGGTRAGLAEDAAARWARKLLAESGPPATPQALAHFAFRLPVYALADVLGFPAQALPRVAAWTGDFAAGISPLADPAAVERGKAGAGELMDLFRARLAGTRAQPPGGLLDDLARRMGADGRGDPQAALANGIGLLFQSYEATAGLIGNTLRLLSREPAVRAALSTEPGLLADIVREVLRYDPPVQNTRRFVAESGPVAGVEMAAGDGILVVVAAANRDPAANPDPHRFDFRRRVRQSFTFGLGVHGCPGEALAVTIAAAGVRECLRGGWDPGGLPEPVTYRPSVNVRIPF